MRNCSFVAFLCIAWLFSPCSIADSNPAAIQAKIDKFVSEWMTQTGAPGISVAVGIDNQLRFETNIGLADVENDIPVTSKSRFRTASIAKAMTAVVVLSLAEQGAIDLDVEVQKYCPEFPPKRWPLTTKQLLGHLAGVRHYKSAEESRSTDFYVDIKAALGVFAKDPLVHQPGSKYLYSTFGYNLLGVVAEGASGKSYETLLRERVWEPAGMQLTAVDHHSEIISGRVNGYVRPTKQFLSNLPVGHGLKVGELYNAALHDTSMKIPGGGLVSTSSDLVKFAIAVNTGRLLKDDSCRQMWTNQKTDDAKETGYGLGWNIGKLAGRKSVSHTGGQAGTSTVLLMVPETGIIVAMMCNQQDSGLLPLARKIAAAVQTDPLKSDAVDYRPALELLTSAIRTEVDQKQLPAISMSLVDGDRTIWADGFGFQDREKKIPATSDTVYRVGSVSKLFTDIAVMQLAETGKVNLDASVQTYIPSFSPVGSSDSPVTLRQLMSHRSGLVRESPVGNYFDPTEPTLAKTVESLNRTRFVYPPNTRTKYSNAAVSVVGAVLESQLEKSHPQQVRETILEPLEMKRSDFVISPILQSHVATGWMRTYDGRRFEAPKFLLGTGPAGNMYASMNDLAKFLSCLFRDGRISATEKESGKILELETLREMLTPIKNANGKFEGFGLGFQISQLDGYTKIGHGGAVYGFSTQLEAIPDRKIGVCASASLDGSNGVVERLCNYALRLMIATQDGMTLPVYETTIPVPDSRAQELVGTYRESKGSKITRISKMADEVFLQRGVVRTNLRSKAEDGTLVTDDAAGFGTVIKLIDSKQLQIADVGYERLPNQPPEEIPDRWKGLIGEYGWDHNTLYILEEDNQLFALIEWFYYYPLKEVDENTFEFPDYGLYHGEGLKFTRDPNGQATEVIAAEVRFARRDVGTKDGETFKIKPVRPIDELRSDAIAAQPPQEQGGFIDAELVEVKTLDANIHLDIRYASTNNFTGSVFYNQPRAFMQKPAAQAVARANQKLKEYGLGLLIHDAYRPWHVTKMFWDATPNDLKDFVANPAKGSRHNRGCAVDIALYELKSGQPIQMVAGYDEFSPRSFPLYPGGTSRQRWYRELLRSVMESEGFSVYEFEWWHFDYKDWKKYRIGNVTFEGIAP